MEPKQGDRRLEDMGIYGAGETNRSLPPPPQRPATQKSCQRPHRRALIAASALVVSLPITVWDLLGERVVDKNWLVEHRQAVKPPDWLAVLPDFVGLALTVALFAALGWLILEYWLQSWGKWWFIALGSLCIMGVLAALAGREATEAVPVNDYPGFRWIYVLAFLYACVLSSILLVSSLYKGDVQFVVLPFHKLKHFVKRHKNALLAIAGVLVALGIANVVVATIIPGNPITEAIAVLFLAPLVMGAMGAVFGSIVLIPFVIASFAIWFVLFRSADLVLRRKVYW
jgi:hypothetical protein